MTETTEKRTPVLEFRDASFAGERSGEAVLEGVDLRLTRGDLALVRVERTVSCPPLAAAAEGMLSPTTRSVWFQGNDWSRCRAAFAARLRGRIGRTFDQGGWVSNLSVLENVTLRLRQHTSRPNREIGREADRWSCEFGLEGVPKGRSSFIAAADLRRAQWVRAFLGDPPLMLLERPMQQVSTDHLASLCEAVASAQRRGGAVLWITSDERVWKSDALDTASRHEIVDRRLETPAEASK